MIYALATLAMIDCVLLFVSVKSALERHVVDLRAALFFFLSLIIFLLVIMNDVRMWL